MTAQRGPCGICGIGQVEWDDEYPDEGCHPVGVTVTDDQARRAMAYLHYHPGVITEDLIRGAILAALGPIEPVEDGWCSCERGGPSELRDPSEGHVWDPASCPTPRAQHGGDRP